MLSRDQFRIFALVLAVAASSVLVASCGGSRAQSNKKEGATAGGAATPAPAVDVTTAPAIVRSLPRFIEA
ncbi:MAG: hypothetical protein LC754_08700, partial [Acidobacteria bacterium]|nr:hypothetical protein [Acidobacteriota bacterium]